MTAIRFHALCRYMARGSSSAVTSSRAVMPAMSQKPPAGMALKPYSVSPRRKLNSLGPKPM
jgi:hypothetical protein